MWEWIKSLVAGKQKKGAVMPFEVHVDGVNQSKLIQIETPFSTFYVANAGVGKEEGSERFFYGDDNNQFFFAASFDIHPDGLRIVTVHTVMVRLFSGLHPGFSADHAAIIKKNLTWLFEERVFGFFHKPLDKSKYTIEVKFTYPFLLERLPN